MYEVLYAKQADRALRRMPRNQAQVIRAKIEEIAQDPYAQHNTVTKLVGRAGYRLRVDDWRVLYKLQDQQLIMLVVKVASRGDVYR